MPSRHLREIVKRDRWVKDVRAWSKGSIRVISGLEFAKLPRSSSSGLQYHLSVAYAFVPGQAEVIRASDATVQEVVKAFGLPDGWEEDNHEPGRARHLWCPVDPVHRVACECATDETTLVEPDGHTWSNDTRGMSDPALCRGCRISKITGKPCPIHGKEAV